MAKKGRLRAKEDDELPKAKFTRENFKRTLRLLKYIQPRWKFLLGMLFLGGTAAVALLFPILTGRLIGLFGDNTSSAQKLETDMWLLLRDLIAILVLQGLVSFGRVLMFTQVSENMLFSVRTDLFSNLMKLPMGFYSKSHASELNSRIATDVNMIGEAFTTNLAELIRQSIIVIGGTATLFYFGKDMLSTTLKFLIVIPPIALITVIFARKIRKFSKELQDKIAQSNIIVGEALTGIGNVKSFTNEGYEIGRYKKLISEIRQFAYKYGFLRGTFFTFIITCFFGGLIYLIWSLFLMKIQNQLNAYDLGVFLMVAMFVAASISGLPDQIAAIQRAMGATERVFELIDTKGEDITTLAAANRSYPKLKGVVKFDNVSFHYPTRPDFPVLQEVSFHAEQGQTIALVGPSGSGKSTIASLVLRFYNPEKGEIYFDGKKASDFSLTELRHNMAIVPQDVMLFGGTIRDNIEYGRPGATMEEITEAAKKANAFSFIESFPDKFETLVGDRGIQLSGGQRQRIAIARAVLKNPSILILDEATSSLDSESERLVQDALDKLMEGRTSIVIAHRLSTIKNADKIIVLERGMVKEVGTHQELIEIPDGLYRSLSKLQFELA